MFEPLNPMGVEDKLVFRLHVVEDRHLPVSNDYELLFLEGVQPADEVMRCDAACKVTACKRYVGHIGVEIVAAVRRHRSRLFAKEIQNCGNIVRRETPKNILLCAKFSEIQARGIDVLNLAEVAFTNKRFQHLNRGVVLKQVPDHQDAAVLPGKLVELLCMFHVKGKRLFDENILPHFERSLVQAKMLCP